MALDQPVTVKADGRTERRDRNRIAVLDALLDLIEEGNRDPTVTEISERCNISHRSVFRYFDDLAVLFQDALDHASERYRESSRINEFGRGSFDDRLSAIVDQRLELFRAVGPLVASARSRQGAMNALAGAFEAYNVPLRFQVERQFAVELAELDPTQRESILAAVDAMLSFECHEFVTRTARSEESARAMYKIAIRAILNA